MAMNSIGSMRIFQTAAPAGLAVLSGFTGFTADDGTVDWREPDSDSFRAAAALRAFRRSGTAGLGLGERDLHRRQLVAIFA